MSLLLNALLTAVMLTGWLALGVLIADVVRGGGLRWIRQGNTIRRAFIGLSVFVSVALTLWRWNDFAGVAAVFVVVGGFAGFQAFGNPFSRS